MANLGNLSIELLECILLYLPMQDLLRFQMVSRDWRELIQTSPQLQRNLFLGFVPSGTPPPDQLSRFVFDNSTSAMAESEEQSLSESLDEKDESAITSTSEGRDMARVRFNPVFPSEGDVLRTRTKQFREPLDSDKSWLDMYLTQPPCTHAEATVFYTKSSRRWPIRRSRTVVHAVSVSRPEGVRARDVLQEARECKLGDTRKWQRIDIHVPGVIRD